MALPRTWVLLCVAFLLVRALAARWVGGGAAGAACRLRARVVGGTRVLGAYLERGAPGAVSSGARVRARVVGAME